MDRIAKAIRRSGLRDAHFARSLGLSTPAMSDRMRGRTRWTLTEAALIARMLGVSLDDLVGDDDLDLGYLPIGKPA